jgi:hypothetical protein
MPLELGIVAVQFFQIRVISSRVTAAVSKLRVNARNSWHAWSLNLLPRRPVTALAARGIVEFVHQLEIRALDAGYYKLGNPTVGPYHERLLPVINQDDCNLPAVITVDGARSIYDRQAMLEG